MDALCSYYLDQCSFELTNTSLLLVYSSSLQSSLVFVPRIKTGLEIIIHYRTKNIPVSHISLCKSVPRISPFQFINTLFHNKDILRVSACKNVSIMIHVINVQHSMRLCITTFNHTNLYIFPVRTFVLVCPSICPSHV